MTTREEQPREEPRDKKDLKIQALLERLSNLTAQYENQVADLRVELTLVTDELEELTQSATQKEAAAKSSV